MKNAVKYLFAFGLGIGILYWLLKDQDLNAIKRSFQDANYGLVLLALILSLGAHISRGYRWKLMLKPMGYNPSLLNITNAVLIGYFTNLILPRAGELARSASLQKTEEIPFEKSFGAVIAERVIDVFVAVILIFLNLIFEFGRIKGLVYEMFGEKLKNANNLLIFAFLGLAFLGILFWIVIRNKERLFKIPIMKKILGIVEGLISGFSSVLKIKNPGLFFFHTILIWVLYYLSTYALCQSVGIGQLLSPLAIFTILVMGSIGMAAPTVGGMGSYHYLVSKILTLYGVNANDGINLAFYLHTMNSIVFIGVLGAIAFLLILLSKK